jgi:hypothetical protein
MLDDDSQGGNWLFSKWTGKICMLCRMLLLGDPVKVERMGRGGLSTREAKLEDSGC